MALCNTERSRFKVTVSDPERSLQLFEHILYLGNLANISYDYVHTQIGKRIWSIIIVNRK